MRKRSFKSKEFLWKYLLSYFLILILPLCSLFLFAYNHAIFLTQSNVLINKENGVLQLRSLLDMGIKNANDMIRDIRVKRVMQDFCPEKSGYQCYEAVRKLREYTTYNQFLASVVYYMENGDYVVSDMGTVPVEYFGEKVYRWEGKSGREIGERLAGKEIKGYQDSVQIPGMQTQDYMVYFYPQTDKELGNVTIVVFYSLNEIKKIVGTSIGYDDYLLIQDPYKNTVWESGNSSKKREKNTEVFTYKSAETGWCYEGVLDYGAAAKEMTRLKSYYLGLLLGLLILGSMSIYYFLYKNYRPIQKLKNQVQELIPGLTINSLNEMETVQHAVVVLSETLEKAVGKMRDAEPILKRDTLAKMLWGIPVEEDKMPDFFLKNVETKCYLVAGFYSENIEKERMDVLHLIISRMRSEEFDGVILEKPYVQETIVVFCFAGGKILEITDTMENLAIQYRKETGKNIQIFLSDPKTGIEELKNAFWEACMVRELVERKPKKSLYTYVSMLTDKRKTEDLFSELMRKLEIAVFSSNVDNLVALSSRFMAEDTSCLSKGGALGILVRMMGITSNYIDNSQVVKKMNQKISIKMLRLVESENCEMLGNICAEYCMDMIENLIKKEEKEDSRIKMDVLLEYINQYATSEEFSLSAMAEHFQLSPSWLSHYFSSNMHMTLIEYVNRLKMDAAKTMLKNSGIGLDELAKNFGYASTSSFIRSFKNIVGMTPGKYRKIDDKK